MAGEIESRGQAGGDHLRLVEAAGAPPSPGHGDRHDDLTVTGDSREIHEIDQAAGGGVVAAVLDREDRVAQGAGVDKDGAQGGKGRGAVLAAETGRSARLPTVRAALPDSGHELGDARGAKQRAAALADHTTGREEQIQQGDAGTAEGGGGGRRREREGERHAARSPFLAQPGYTLGAVNITVHLFASLAEAAGTRRVEIGDLPAQATVGDLGRALCERFPALAQWCPSILYAVNAEYVRPDFPVRPGDEVALIPPVSGGEEAEAQRYRITDAPLDLQALHRLVRADASGAVAIFTGVVRATNLGRPVAYLEYDAYPEMATKTMRQIAEEVRARWAINEIALHHRVGRLAIGEASVAIAVSAPHRREAMEACHYAIDRLKAIVPIWKKEVWTDSEHWVEGSLTPQAEAGPSPTLREAREP